MVRCISLTRLGGKVTLFVGEGGLGDFQLGRRTENRSVGVVTYSVQYIPPPEEAGQVSR